MAMYAVTITEPGGPDVLRWAEVPDPQPGPGEVLIDVHATAVNRADILQRQGLYPAPKGRPPYPGLECSGRIAAFGPNAESAGTQGWNVGDQVCALLSGGGYAQQVAIEAAQLLPRPTNVSLTEAAGLPEVACTVWSNVADLARLKAGETLLVHGGGSGIGTFAIQFAKAIGANVVTTARKAKHDALTALGADATIDYSDEDFVEGTMSATGGAGADVILDIMGAAYLARNVAALATGGRIVVIGMQGGRKAELDLGALLAKRGTISATSLRARTPEEKAVIVRAVREEVWPLVESGAIRVVVDRVLPMTEAAEAHRLVESNAHLGKVLLVNELNE
jgi:putative PIG3 family NAD(P)H quinone oxidoreductase